MKTQIAGITMVCDLAGFGFKHLRYRYSQRTVYICDAEEERKANHNNILSEPHSPHFHVRVARILILPNYFLNVQP